MQERVVALHTIVFRRSPTVIVAGDIDFPYGGTYEYPVPENGLWSRTPLPGNDPLYVSMRIFTSDGLFPQEDEWSPPVLFVKHGDKGDTGASGNNGNDGSHGLNGAIGTPGNPGVNGANGVAGNSIVWVGSIASHPSNPTYGTAYYNTTDHKSYVFYDGTWYQMTVDGTDGQNGYHSTIVNLYKKSTSSTVAPESFSGTFTYNFSNALLTGGTLNGWTQTMPSSAPGEYIWVKQASAVSDLTEDTIAANEFSGAVVISGIGLDGIAGLDGTSVVLKGSVATVNDLPTGAAEGDLYVVLADGFGRVSDGANGWANVGQIQGPPGQAGWSVQIVYHDAPATGAAPTLPTDAAGINNGWYTIISAAANWMTLKVDNGTGTVWGTPTKISGVDGLNSATVTLYQKTSTTTPPALIPEGNFIYTFATKVLSASSVLPFGVFNSWSQTMPSLANGEYLWVIQATASSRALTDTISFSEFSVPVITSSTGNDGLSIVWKGDLATPPVNPEINWVYRDTDNSIVYIYNGFGWELMVLDGSDGVDGTNGINGTNGTNGDSVDIVFVRDVGTPLAPTASPSVPSEPIQWYTTVAAANTAGGTTNKLWSSVGYRPLSTGNYTWDTPVRIDGDMAAEVTVFTRGVPTTTPVGGTYTFGAASPITSLPESIGATWNRTIPAGTSAVYTSRGLVSTVSGNTAAVTITHWSTPVISLQNGTNGINGTRTAILDMYKWSVAAPTTFPSGSSIYTWATGQFGAPVTSSGWELTPPTAVLGQTLWIARTIYADQLTTTTTSITWTATTAKAVGAAGINGIRTAFLELYKWSATVPTEFPSGTSTYTWATGAFTAPTTANTWSLTPGAAVTGQTLYACSVTYVDSLTTPTATVTWNTSTAYAVGASGSNGLSVYITYNDAPATGAAPSAPTNVAGTSVATVNGTNYTWHTEATSASNWMSQKVDDGTTANWGAAIKIKAVDGATGATGPAGLTGSSVLVAYIDAISTGTPSASPGIPSGWFDASGLPVTAVYAIWETTGTRDTGGTNYTWSIPVISTFGWRKPGTTTIDGNKIFTGDAYVDTLQIQGNAIWVPDYMEYTTSSCSVAGTSSSGFAGGPTVDYAGGKVMLYIDGTGTNRRVYSSNIWSTTPIYGADSGTVGSLYMRHSAGGFSKYICPVIAVTAGTYYRSIYFNTSSLIISPFTSPNVSGYFYLQIDFSYSLNVASTIFNPMTIVYFAGKR